MAFESLSDRFQGIIKKVKGQSKLTEANMEEMLKEIADDDSLSENKC